MARYIDADALIKKIFPYDVVDKRHYRINAKAVYDAICAMPTADVVPKSEVERLNKELDELAEELSDLIVEKDYLFDEVVRLRDTIEVYEETSGSKQAKREVARQIFEEIENLFAVENFRLICNRQAFAELKKKYTEDQNDDH